LQKPFSGEVPEGGKGVSTYLQFVFPIP
jgi:hypothetical protein